MACLVAPPSVHGRRLFELLEEKQEPFLLDIYLVENGYSDKHVTYYSMCWPGNACKRLQRFASNGFMVGLFKCIISNCLHVKSIRKALKWDKKASGSRSLGISCLSNVGGSKIDEEFNQEGTCSSGNNGRVSDGDPLWKCMEMDEPVSVLGLRSCEPSPVNQTQNIVEEVSTFDFELQRKALDIFEELLQMAYTPAFDILTKSKVHLDLVERFPAQCDQKETNERISYYHECLRHKMTETTNEITQQQRRNVDPSITGKATVWELSKSWRNWKQFQRQEKGISSDLEDAILEDIIEETVAEML